MAGAGAGCVTVAPPGGAVLGAGGGLFWASAASAVAAVSAAAAIKQMTADRIVLEVKLRRLTASPSWPTLYGQGAITTVLRHLMRTA
jgi:hypothetical protein